MQRADQTAAHVVDVDAHVTVAGQPLEPEQPRSAKRVSIEPREVQLRGGHAIAGLWTREVVILAGMAVPVVVVVVLVAARGRARIARLAGPRVIHVLILALGIVELYRALR